MLDSHGIITPSSGPPTNTSCFMRKKFFFLTTASMNDIFEQKVNLPDSQRKNIYLKKLHIKVKYLPW